MVSFRDLQTEEDVVNWSKDLDERWPERAEIKQHILTQLKALPFDTLNVLEFCSGQGSLAAYLLPHFPQMRYVGLDSSKPLLTYAQKCLASFEPQATLRLVDLNEAAWLDEPLADGQPVKTFGWQAIISLQSLHDLGAEAEVNRIYRFAKALLVSRGLFLNADLVGPQATPQHPGRLTTSRHLTLLQAHGFVDVACSLEVGEFACVVGRSG